jgi:hypothetical protein
MPLVVLIRRRSAFVRMDVRRMQLQQPNAGVEPGLLRLAGGDVQDRLFAGLDLTRDARAVDAGSVEV